MLGPLTKELIDTQCPPENQQEVRDLLSQKCAFCLPGVGAGAEWMDLIDRIQLAAIRRSGWKMAKIEKAVALAQIDWRDLLMASGFGEHLEAHIQWQKEALGSHDPV